MAMKQFLLATVASGVAMWMLAGVWHQVVAATFYKKETHASHQGIGIIFVAYLLLAALMIYLYSVIGTDAGPILTGLKVGVLVGILWVFPHELAMAGAHGKSITYVFRNATWHVAEQGMGGVVVGLVYAYV
jgi:hypothetical protein